MSRPKHTFPTNTHTVYQTDVPDTFRAVPGDAILRLATDAQQVPPGVLDAEMERAVTAWVMARGERTLRLNGAERAVAPSDLDRPPGGAVRRVVSIAPSNAEIVGALGATDLLVGTESSSDYPPVVNTLPRVGPDLAVDVEQVAALEPDLVLASLSVPGMERNIAALEQAGLRYLVLAPRTIADIRADIRRVGEAIGYADAARGVVADMDERLQRLQAEAAEHAPVPVYLEWWPKPMFTPGHACWSNELIALAGGRNIFADLPGQSGEVTAEQVSAADPDVIFLSWCGVPFEKLNPQRVLQREGLTNVSAIRSGRVVPVDESLLGRPGPRVLEGVARMAEVIREARSGREAERSAAQ